MLKEHKERRGSQDQSYVDLGWQTHVDQELMTPDILGSNSNLNLMSGGGLVTTCEPGYEDNHWARRIEAEEQRYNNYYNSHLYVDV